MLEAPIVYSSCQTFAASTLGVFAERTLCTPAQLNVLIDPFERSVLEYPIELGDFVLPDSQAEVVMPTTCAIRTPDETDPE